MGLTAGPAQFGDRVRFAEGKKRPGGERPRVQFGDRVRFAEGKKRSVGERTRVRPADRARCDLQS